jgi:hypothetical protein
MVTRRAECSCGQLSVICSGDPIRISVCHCLACKRRTGSAFSFNARFAENDVSIRGRAVEFTRTGGESGRVTYSFCPDCGSTVHYRIDAESSLVAIPAGLRRPFVPAALPVLLSRKPALSVGRDPRRTSTHVRLKAPQ